MIRLDSGEAVPVQSIIDGAKYAAFIDEAVMFVTQKMKERGDELAESVIEKLKMVYGKHVIENASAEFVSFIEDAYKSMRTGTALDTGAIIKCDPACAGFQLAPAFRGTSTSGFCHNGEHALAGVITGLRIVRTRTFADIKVVSLCTSHYLRSVRGDSFTTHFFGKIQYIGIKYSSTTTYSVSMFSSAKNRPSIRKLMT